MPNEVRVPKPNKSLCGFWAKPGKLEDSCRCIIGRYVTWCVCVGAGKDPAGRWRLPGGNAQCDFGKIARALYARQQADKEAAENG